MKQAISNLFISERNHSDDEFLINKTTRFGKPDRLRKSKSVIRLISLLFVLLFVSSFSYGQLNINHYIRVGQTRIQIGNYVGAIENFNIVIKFKPQLPESYYYRAVAKHQLEDFRGAIRDYDKAIDIKPYYPDAFMHRGLAYLELKEYDKALEDYDKALELDPNNEAIYNNRGIAKLSLKDVDGAIADYDKALKINPNFINAFVNRSNANILKGDIREGIRDLNRAIIIRPHYANAYLLRGLARFGLEDYAAALRDFDQTIKLDPQNAYAYNNRGIVKQKLEDYQGAIMDYDLALEINPTLPNAYFNRGIAKEILEIAGYEHDYEVAAKLDPSLNIRQRMIEEDALAQNQQQTQQQQQGTQTGQQQAGSVQQQNSSTNKQQAQNTQQKTPAQTPNRPNTQQKQEETKEQRDRRRFRLSLADTRNLPTDEDVEVEDGRIQNRNIIIELQDLFVISSYSQHSINYERMQYYNMALEELNRFNNYTPTLTITNIEMTRFVDYFRNNILYFNEKIKINEAPENYLSRGIFKFMVNEYNEAMEDFDKAISLDEKNTLAHFSRANCRTKMVELLESLPDFSEDLTVPVGSNVNREQDKGLEFVTEYESILDDYQVCVFLRPNFPFAYYNKAYILCKLDRYEEAIRNLDKAIELQPDFAEAYYNRGLTKIYLDDVDGGAMDLSKAGEFGIQEAYNVIKRYCN
ncbi:tetratricopeptide repeat protein [Sunxiuqinia indica]|uniref:tetratricopeptide repeat protein n=1 Tax=Sunxiuqinia indica TaxID=2692584 RepID=UPI001358FA36|nr:tetratricopeptide repeat protein [Sunxiuqinia indica]